MTASQPAPAITAIGGGHGLSASLRALRQITPNLTAVVSVADNGGSTGRLRQGIEQPAPGDLRKCLVALAGEESLFVRSLEHRFESDEFEGHALGNLLIATMAEKSNLIEALSELGGLVDAVGELLPTTSSPVTLVAVTSDGTEVHGQVQVMATPNIETLRADPPEAIAEPEAVKAIERADMLLLGPGSLFTSVLAALVVPGISEAVRASSAKKVYVCNLRPQESETRGFDARDHVEVLRRHGVHPDVMVYDPTHIGPYVSESDDELTVISTPLVGADGYEHDSALLAAAIESLF